MKKYTNVSLICTLLVALFLLGACSVEYRSRHNHPMDEHHMDHDNHNDDHH